MVITARSIDCPENDVALRYALSTKAKSPVVYFFASICCKLCSIVGTQRRMHKWLPLKQKPSGYYLSGKMVYTQLFNKKVGIKKLRLIFCKNSESLAVSLNLNKAIAYESL